MRTIYRATCLGKPIGPWRDKREKACEDLIDRRLGSYDEWGRFYITVPGDLEMQLAYHQSKAA